MQCDHVFPKPITLQGNGYMLFNVYKLMPFVLVATFETICAAGYDSTSYTLLLPAVLLLTS